MYSRYLFYWYGYVFQYSTSVNGQPAVANDILTVYALFNV